MNPRVVQNVLCAALFACLSASHTTFAQAARPVISLDPVSAAQTASLVPLKGEASYAHAPANFYAFPSARVGELADVQAVRLRFSAATTLTGIESTKDFTIENGSSCMKGNSYTAGDVCIVLVRFAPQGPGRRIGKLTISHTASAEPDSIGLGGFGYAPVVSFTPALITTVPGTYPSSTGLLSSAQNMTDAGDVLYIADTGNTLIRQIDSSGTIVNTTPVAAPASLAVDNFGLIYLLGVSGSTDYFSYYEPNGGYTFYFSAYKPGTCTVSAPCVLGNVGMGEPAEINIDRDNNLFLEEETDGAMEAPVSGLVGEGLLPSINVWYLNDVFAYTSSPASTFAVDGNDYLYTDYNYSTSTCYIVQEPVYGAEGANPNYTRVVGASMCGFSGDGGQATAAEIGAKIGQIAFDTAGNLYFSDTNNQRVRMINYNTGIINTIAGDGTAGYTGDGSQATSAELANPTGVAVDSQGQVYIISATSKTATAQVVRKLGVKGFLAFGQQAMGTSGAVHLVTVSNTGNTTLTLSNNAVITGTNPGDFTINQPATTCPLTTGGTLEVGQTCQVGIVFKPAATGARTANLVFLDNTVTNSNTVQMDGTGTSSAAQISPGTVSFPSTMVNHIATDSVTITNSGNADLTVSGITLGGSNPKMFSSTSTCTGKSIAPKATCTLTVTYEPTAAGTQSATVKITDNAPGSPHTVALAGTAVAPAAASVRLTSSANPATNCAPVVFTVSVTSPAGEPPVGSIQLKKGEDVLADATLIDGTARLTASGLPAGTNLLTAAYSGDATHAASNSAALAQTVTANSACRVVTPFQAQ